MTAKLNILLFFAFIIILSLNYCIKNDDAAPPYKDADFYECHNQQSWDSLKIINKLLGRWISDSIKCPILGTKSMREENYKLIFGSNSKLAIYQENNMVKEVKWTISVNDNIYNIHTEPSVDKVYGAVFICNNKVVFYNSWLDGCDYFYTKIEE